MTDQQVAEMKAARSIWLGYEIEHRRQDILLDQLNIVQAMWCFEVGWCMAKGLPIRRTPAWISQPGLISQGHKAIKPSDSIAV